MAFSNSTDKREALRRWGWRLTLLAVVALSWQLGSLQRQALLDDLEDQGRQELNLYVSHLAGQLNRYAFLPALLADDFRLQSLLIAPQNSDQQVRVNRLLAHVNAIAGSLDVYLMDADGITVAASNWQDELTFIGRDFSFRPYFVEAMAGRSGRYYALGTTSGRRGSYFSLPVGEPGKPTRVSLEDVLPLCALPLESDDPAIIAAADSGDPLAQCELAILFLNAKRPADAITWFTFSAKQFYADAMCFLGRHFLSGDGVPRDEKAGLLWLSRAATKEHPVARALIAFLQSPEGQQRLAARDQVALDKMLDNIERRILLTALQETADPARPG